MGCKQILKRGRLQVADVTGEAVVLLVIQLVAGDSDLVRIDDDEEIPGIDVGGVDRLVLALQAASEFGRQAAKRLVGCVD